MKLYVIEAYETMFFVTTSRSTYTQAAYAIENSHAYHNLLDLLVLTNKYTVQPTNFSNKGYICIYVNLSAHFSIKCEN